MALNWSIKGIDPDTTTKRVTSPSEQDRIRRSMTASYWEDYQGDGTNEFRVLKTVTYALIWHTMTVGMNHITEKNWREFFIRVSLEEKVHGATAVTIDEDGNMQPRPITVQDVQAHIGLRTNAKPDTKHQWMKRFRESYFRCMEQVIDTALEFEEAA